MREKKTKSQRSKVKSPDWAEENPATLDIRHSTLNTFPCAEVREEGEVQKAPAQPSRKPRSERNLHRARTEWNKVKALLKKHGKKLRIYIANFYHEEGKKSDMPDIPLIFAQSLYHELHFASFELPRSSVRAFLEEDEVSQIAEDNPFWKKMLGQAKRSAKLLVYGTDTGYAQRYVMHRIRANYEDPLYRNRLPADHWVKLEGNSVKLADIGADFSDGQAKEGKGEEESIALVDLLSAELHAELLQHRMVVIPEDENPYKTGTMVLLYPPHKTIRSMFDRIVGEYGDFFERIGLAGDERYHFIQRFFFTHAMIVERDVVQCRKIASGIYKYLRNGEVSQIPDEMELVHTGGLHHHRSLLAIFDIAGAFEEGSPVELGGAIYDPREPLPQGALGSTFFAEHMADILDHTTVYEDGVSIDIDYYVKLFGIFMNESPHGYRLGAYLVDLLEYDLAIEALKRAQELYPDDPVVEQSLAHCYHWSSVKYMGDEGRAERTARERLALQHARRATALDDRAWQAWSVLAQLGFSRRNYPLTIKYARKALTLHPVHGLNWYVLTQAYRFFGRLHEALKAIKVGIRHVKKVDLLIRDLMWRELEICYRRNKKYKAARYVRSHILDDSDLTIEKEEIEEIVQMLDSLDNEKAPDAKQAPERGENRTERRTPEIST